MNKPLSNLISQAFGRFASKRFSPSIQGWINRTYVKMMKLDMCEFHAPESYPTLNALFTRSLLTPRTFETSKEVMIAPCDAFITECGTVEDFKALQIKGMAYDVREFLTSHVTVDASIESGEYINFYLSPKDYHRYHVPLDMRVTKAIHVPGKLYPVNIPSLKKRLNLFIQNERVVLECEHDGVRFYLVLVGALNVGQMVVNFEPSIETNKDTTQIKVHEYETIALQKGEELGFFKMGSTVILIAPQGMLDVTIAAHMHVKFGQTIAMLNR